MADTPAGWYPDPSGDQSKIRYWDGTQWTDDYQDNPNAVAQPPASPYQAAGDQPYQQAPGSQPAPGAQPGYQTSEQPVYQQPQGSYPPQLTQPVVDNSGKATASLVLGLVGIPGGCFIALIGYICGGLALTFGLQARNSSKKGMATAGIVLGVITIIFSLINSILGVMLANGLLRL